MAKAYEPEILAACGLVKGLTASVEIQVTQADTAIVDGTGQVPVLATPRLVAGLEAATLLAVRGHYPEGRTSVSTRIQVAHLAASKVGAFVVCEARLESVADRHLWFGVSARDDVGMLASGIIRRTLVNPVNFMNRAR